MTSKVTFINIREVQSSSLTTPSISEVKNPSLSGLFKSSDTPTRLASSSIESRPLMLLEMRSTTLQEEAMFT